MECTNGREKIADCRVSVFCRKLATLGVLVTLAGGCATQQAGGAGGSTQVTVVGGNTQESTVLNEVDKSRVWLGETFADVVDSADKVFGERRVEDRQQIVRAKVGVRAKVREGMDTEWGVPANFRIPLPALGRKANVFLDFTADADTSDLSNPEAALREGNSSFSATALRKLTENVDLGASLSIEALDNFGPELFARFERRKNQWGFFAEQRGFYRTDDGWGGVTAFNIDYRLPSETSFIRFANRADYYEALHDVDLKSGFLYRRPYRWGTALSAETGVEYNPYNGDPESSDPTGPEDDEDQLYIRLRMIGRVLRPWIEWEVMPGYYYMWEHEDKQVWGIDLKVSLIYESFLSGGQ